MEISLLVTGSLKESYLKTAQEKFLGSLLKKNNISKFTVFEFKDIPLKENSSTKEEDLVREKESKRIIEKLESKDFVIILDLKGKKGDHKYFSNLINRVTDLGKEKVVFVIGGSLGLSEELKKRGESINLSSLTYPHQLFRIALLEALVNYL